jgi:hypothetical protein
VSEDVSRVRGKHRAKSNQITEMIKRKTKEKKIKRKGFLLTEGRKHVPEPFVDVVRFCACRAVNESCNVYEECDLYDIFAATKPIWGIE